MQPLTLQECQQEALKVLIKFDEICKKNNFKYFLMYGTLIGAIRHNGFIPWDDDLDVMMPREDFDKFVDYSKTFADKIYPLKLCDRTNTKNYSFGIPRFVNMEYRYVADNQDKGELDIDLGTFIDIYPLDNYGNTEQESDELFKKCMRLNRRFAWYLSPVSTGGFLRTIVKTLLHFYVKFSEHDGYEERIEEELKQLVLNNTSENDKFSGLVVWTTRVVLEKAKLNGLELTDHIFEGHMFPIPKCYDYILTKVYGDYMKLPPLEKRSPYHGYKIYKR